MIWFVFYLLQKSQKSERVFFKSAEWKRKLSYFRNPRARSQHSQKKFTYRSKIIQTWVYIHCMHSNMSFPFSYPLEFFISAEIRLQILGCAHFFEISIYLFILFNFKNPKLGAHKYKDKINKSKLTWGYK